jgi:hypothetical protein
MIQWYTAAVKCEKIISPVISSNKNGLDERGILLFAI